MTRPAADATLGGPGLPDYADAQRRLAHQMNDPWFWHKLVPGLTIHGEAAPRRPEVALEAEAWARARDRLGADGFAVTHGATPRPALLDGVLRLHASGLPPAMIFMYDEPWLLAAQLHPLFVALLGPDYYLDSGFWTWHVPVGDGHAGWGPHRDYLGAPGIDPDGSPWGFSVWLPLTPTTPENGCMYVIPARYSRGDLDIANFHDVHALPAAPGDVLMWRPDVWHWGGRSSAFAPNPRTSIGFEVYRPGSPVTTPPTQPARELPSFRRRLALCGLNLIRYDATREWHVLASHLVRLDPAVDRPVTP
jgi:hypothetical protein